MKRISLVSGLFLLSTLAFAPISQAQAGGPQVTPVPGARPAPLLLPGESPIKDEIFLGPCSATLDCGDQVISCSGNSVCTASQTGGYVECDGNRTTCPNRCVVSIFCSCECRSGTLSCFSNSGDCQKSGGTITCNGFTVTCDRFCSRPCIPRIP